MLIDTEQIMSVTQLQRQLTKKIREVSESNIPVYILKNNQVAAVILSADEYEMLKQAEEILEHLEIADVVEKRLKNYTPNENISWEDLKQKHGL